MLIDPAELFAAVICAVMVVVLAVFFRYTGRPRPARGRRRSPGRHVGRDTAEPIWVVVWAASGIVSLVAGIIWGSKLGVQFSVALVALKALPVLILGGFTSIPAPSSAA